MTLEQQVCSLELAKRLKELGVKQREQEFYHVSFRNESSPKEQWHNVYHEIVHGEDELEELLERSFLKDKEWCAAFTVAELGEMLPLGYLTGRYLNKEDEYWICDSEQTINSWSAFKGAADTEADARAKMLVHLLENKLITL